jgi:hypothetical protein
MLKFKTIFKNKAEDMVNILLPNATDTEKGIFKHGFVSGAMWVYENPNIYTTPITKDYLLNNDFFEARTNNYRTFIKNRETKHIFGSIDITFCGDYWNLSIMTEGVNLFKRINTIEEFLSSIKYCINDIENYDFSFNNEPFI